jgi:hypothetical protein
MSTIDPTEAARRALIADGPVAPEGQTWTTAQLQEDFDVTGFLAPFVVVRRRADGVVGSLQFNHSPRVYFGWTPDAR